MKSFKYIATLAVAAAGLATQADAIPITYSYTGANFTFGTGPGFTTNDNITASFTVDKPLPPNMAFDLTLIGRPMLPLATVSTRCLLSSLSTTVESLMLLEISFIGFLMAAKRWPARKWRFQLQRPRLFGVQDLAFRHNLDGDGERDV